MLITILKYNNSFHFAVPNKVPVPIGVTAVTSGTNVFTSKFVFQRMFKISLFMMHFIRF